MRDKFDVNGLEGQIHQDQAPAAHATRGHATRGKLRVYLGVASGVGKTYAMLNEGRRAKERGVEVVVGYVETHGRRQTEEQIGDLEIIPRRRVEYRGRTFEEMDVDAVLARKPQLALVDELAHTNVPGLRNAKRYQDVEELLDAGIDVVSTLNIQHLESLNDVVARITGVVPLETVPDDVVRRAEQVELVDMTPEGLRRRIRHGYVYPPHTAEAALANFFRPGNLAALRELALLWLADKVDGTLLQYMEDHRITAAWETRERVVVAIAGAPSDEHLIRRAARIATRGKGDLLGVHVRCADGLASPPQDRLEHQRRLVEELGGTYHEVVADDPAVALVAFARANHATQLVLGASRQPRWRRLLRGSFVNEVIRLAGDIDVDVISTDPANQATAQPARHNGSDDRPGSSLRSSQRRPSIAKSPRHSATVAINE